MYTKHRARQPVDRSKCDATHYEGIALIIVDRFLVLGVLVTHLQYLESLHHASMDQCSIDSWALLKSARGPTRD